MSLAAAGEVEIGADDDKARTIADLARLAGVSAGTVSRALADSPLISQATRDRVQALARAHDFRPNAVARNLRTRKSGAIGVALPVGHEKFRNVSDPFFMAMLGHLADGLSERGYNLLLSRVTPTDGGWLQALGDSGHVDGIIVIGQSDQSATLDRAATRYRPLVVWGQRLPGQAYCSVGSDNRLGGAMAAEHLLQQGCRRLAFFGDPVAPEMAERLEGCRRVLADRGISEPLQVLPAQPAPHHGYREVAAFLKSASHRPDGVFAASDLIAMNTLRAVAEMGLSAPGDIKVVGFDDLPQAAHSSPPLTTIRQDIETGAAQLIDLLFRRIDGEDTQSVVLPPQLVVRGSSVRA